VKKTKDEGQWVRLKNRRVVLIKRPNDGVTLVFRSLQKDRNIGPTAGCRMRRIGKRVIVDADLNLSDEAVMALFMLCAEYLNGRPQYALSAGKSEKDTRP
jgi:hypothetical protein